ncbi:MAG: hypothetical protein AAF806_29155 [Bacteroidota bacterium]
MAKSEKIQSTAAMFVAVIALLISVWQGCEERRYNRFSVRPLLNFDLHSSSGTRTIKLANEGLGPAIFKQFVIEIDGKKYNAENGNPWEAVLEKRGLRNKFSQMYYYADGTIMQANNSANLLIWKVDSIRRLNIVIDVTYESIYEERFHLKEEF